MERTERLLAGAGDPHRLFTSVLIGGTNGKGSVSALCEAALRATGRDRVGLYTSPHLVSFTERIRIGGIPIDAERLAGIAERLRPAIEETGASFFEATTAMAFVAFAEMGVETAVVEVGLGGRLDATNVLSPLVTAVTNIDMEHTEFLGETIEEIAFEKAGIFKRDVPAITGERRSVPFGVLARRAAEVGTSLHELADVVEIRRATWNADGTLLEINSRAWGARSVRTPLGGPHQAYNAAMATGILSLLPLAKRPSWEAIEEGFATVRWPGRLQIERGDGTTWVFDVAHNPAGAHALSEALPTLDLPRPIIAVVGILRDKDWRSMLAMIASHADRLLLTTPDSAPPGRRWDLDEVVAARAAEPVSARDRSGACEVIADLAAALRRAETLAEGGTVLVTGSVHTVGDAMAIRRIPSV